MTALYHEVTDGDAGLLVLLHGLGATGDVWSPFVAARPEWFAGRIAVLDLPGHGASNPLPGYAMRAVADAVVGTLERLQPLRDCLLLGHSYGGVAALELADREHGLAPRHAFGLGIKSLWSESELELMSRLAEKPPRTFATEQAAGEWYQKTTGLGGLSTQPENYTRRGLRQDGDGQWLLAVDPRVNAVADPRVGALIERAACPVSLAHGADDAMIDADDLRRHDACAEAIAGGGHNVMVTHPGAVWEWLRRQLVR